MNTGILEKILIRRYGQPVSTIMDDLPAHCWNPDNWDYATVLYLGMKWEGLTGLRFRSLREIYGNSIGGYLIKSKLNIAHLSPQEISHLQNIDELRMQAEVQHALVMDPSIDYFMDLQNVFFYGVKRGALWVFDAQKEGLNPLGPTEPALEALLDEVESEYLADRVEAADRKGRSEDLLEKKGIPYFPALPPIESDAETELRTAEEIGIRMFCLYCVIGTAYHWSDRSYREYLEKHNLRKHLSPDEASFLSSPTMDRRSAKGLTWRVEALFLLMWTVGLFDTLPLPIRQTDNDEIIGRFPSLEKSPWPFIKSLKLRPTSDILDASDLLYRLHWATRQAEIEGEPPPAGLDPRIVYQWHHAINWVTQYDDSDWDHVATDT